MPHNLMKVLRNYYYYYYHSFVIVIVIPIVSSTLLVPFIFSCFFSLLNEDRFVLSLCQQLFSQNAPSYILERIPDTPMSLLNVVSRF